MTEDRPDTGKQRQFGAGLIPGIDRAAIGSLDFNSLKPLGGCWLIAVDITAPVHIMLIYLISEMAEAGRALVPASLMATAY